MTRKAMISGVTGQDGSYLAELLCRKGYEVHGLHRAASPAGNNPISPAIVERVVLHRCDLSDGDTITKLVGEIRPDEVYNLAGQSRVAPSIADPGYTSNVVGIAVLRFLEAIRHAGLTASTRFFQAGSAELFGRSPTSPQNEDTPFHPRSPYAVAKMFGFWTVKNYRELYGVHASNGILYNHESPRRGTDFVTRKITQGAAAIAIGQQDCLVLGNLSARRDWGHARDFVDGMWRIVQAERADDFVLASGTVHTVEDFVDLSFRAVGITLAWSGAGLNRSARCIRTQRVRVTVASEFFRPDETELLVGDASKAQRELGWRPAVSFPEMVAEMTEAEVRRLSSPASDQ